MSTHRRRVFLSLMVLSPIVLIFVGLLMFVTLSERRTESRSVSQITPGAGGFLEHGIVHDRVAGEDCDPTLVRNTLRSLRVGELQQFENLTVAPLLASSSKNLMQFLTLAEAIRDDAISVQELPDEQVPVIAITLTKDVRVLIQSGGIITGGKQDRYIKRDLLLVEKGKSKVVPVYCVEPGRWTGSERFSGSITASNNLAQSAQASALREADSGDMSGQGEVWWRVRSNLVGVAAESRGSTFANVETSGRISTAREGYHTQFANLAEDHPNAVGVVLAAGDQILGAEIFADHAQFLGRWPSVLDAAVIDALQIAETTAPVGRDDFEGFLTSASRSNVRQFEPIAAGEEYSVSTSEAFGTLLFSGQRLLHARLFPQQAIQLAHEPTFYNEARTQQALPSQ